MRPPHFTDLGFVPPHLLEHAIQHKLPWIRRYVAEGRPRGMVEQYAERASAVLALNGPIPPYSTLMNWALRYEAFGILGLVNSRR